MYIGDREEYFSVFLETAASATVPASVAALTKQLNGLVNIYNFISPSQHGSIAVRTKRTNKYKNNSTRKEANKLKLHNQCLAYIISLTPKSIEEPILMISN